MKTVIMVSLLRLTSLRVLRVMQGVHFQTASEKCVRMLLVCNACVKKKLPIHFMFSTSTVY